MKELILRRGTERSNDCWIVGGTDEDELRKIVWFGVVKKETDGSGWSAFLNDEASTYVTTTADVIECAEAIEEAHKRWSR